MDITERIRKLREMFTEKEIDGILISHPYNRFYLSGFYGSDGYLLITDKQLIIVVDSRYTEQAKRQSPDFKLFNLAGKMEDWFSNLAGGLDIKRLGFESASVTYALYRQLTEILQKKQLPLQLIPTDGIVESLRTVKEPEEIELIIKAVEIADLAIAHIRQIIHSGMTELQVVWEIEKFMRENGSETVPFELIVAAGVNTALPHAHPSEKIIQSGDPVMIDIGAKYKNYTSDITRTICVGEPDKTFRKIYDTVLGAQLAAIAIIKEGMTGEAADNIARTVIQESGYGDNFGHSLGHGIGLETHESPRLAMRSADKLSNGMVFSIEPGIYLPEWGGVRIEDTVVMEKGKIRVLTKADKIVKS
ncbi:MAG: aminopeptidase P family protein [Dehalococcoidales bacterium]|nr:aminopeptidase P family protein [Dehalococcoidales bacterium]